MTEWNGKYTKVYPLILDSLTVVKVKGRCKWAQKAVYKDEVRYRRYYYKSDAVKGLSEWDKNNYPDMNRNFYHNFFTAEDLGINEVKND